MVPVEPDRDTREVIALLDRALTDSGLSQADFAVALGTSASRLSTYRSGRTRPTAVFCVRALRVASALAAARSSRLMSAPETAKAIRHAMGDEDRAWRMLLQGRDHLSLLLDQQDGCPGAWEAAPPSTGSPGFDVLLAALARREFDRAGVEPPAWCEAERLPLPWVPEHPFLDPDEVIAATPDDLKRLNVFVPARDLLTA
ncbi:MULTISPECIES: helix-turn-helix domain-containing protein [Parafrankia]|uniref:helix-turn-helix domain-containing protein n=1 Tax=Parafrankia TaxID=2994362 RepID=UPI000B8A25F6|nr:MULTISPECIES: helix-turn-helix transcriptional regulator [Parafrankia]MBE3203585.1 helix-turn-helix transcriptional regulator [Parafrankia sp. CH37]